MNAEATVAMSRHVATAVTSLAVLAIFVVTAAAGGAPGQGVPSNLTPPSISGTPQVGSLLTATAGTWDGKRLTYAYQWLRCDSTGAGCSSIGAANATTYRPSSADVGATLRVLVTASNRNGSAAATSGATAVVTSPASAPPPPSGTTSYLSDLTWSSMSNGWGPVERDQSNGEQAVGDGRTIALNGQTFTKGLGAHGASDVGYSISGCTRFQASVGVDDEVAGYGTVAFQVYLDGAKVYDSGVMTGASATKSVDVDTTSKSALRLVVTDGGDGIDYDHGDWADARVTCATPPAPPSGSSPSVTSDPTITGTPQQGQTLSASTGSWSGTSLTYAYQWQRCNTAGASCSPVAGATNASYLLGSADLGSTMRASVTASNSWGSATASSAATAVVVAPPSAPSPPSLGSVLYGKTFEDGLALSGGWDVQDSTTVPDTSGIHRGKITADNTTSDAGSWSGRFDLPAYTAERTAAEVLHERFADPGVDDYYAQAFRFNDFAWGDCQNQGLSLGQYNYQGINGSPLALAAQCGTGYGATATNLKSVFVLVNSGNCADATGCPYYSGGPVGAGYASRGMPDPGPYYILSPGNVQLSVWYEVVIHIHWTAGTDGVVEAWIRKRGDSSFTKAFSHSGGFPTLQWGGPNAISVGSLSNYGTNDKFGAYRGPDPNPLRLWQDSFCRATTFDAAATCFR